MTHTTLTTQAIADILARGERTPETRPQTKAFLEQIAGLLRDEVGPMESDVGTRTQSDSRAIQFIDRAYFFVVPELKETYFPYLAVFLMPRLLWWGVYAWGKRSYAESVANAFEERGIAASEEFRVEVGAFRAVESWGTGGHFAAGQELKPDEIATLADTAELAGEIARDLADWWRRLQPHVEKLRDELGFQAEPPGPDFPGTIDIAARLAQWQEETSNRAHPNYYHADLDWPAERYTAIMKLVDKLRGEPASFSREDVVELFGRLNSGNRMKNKVADANSLPELRQQLLQLLDGEGEAAERIRVASQAVAYAGESMMGELYGWVHAEEAPLFNGCATNALRYLGYQFDPGNYDDFVTAHNQFKRVYQHFVGQLRPDIPRNLEVDKFYNVIDKVDARNASSSGRQTGLLAKPFDTLFESYEEAHEILDFFAETARRTGLQDPLDERFALTLRHRHTVLRINLGRWMLVDYGGRKKGWFDLALLSELVPAHYGFEPWGDSFAYTERSVQLFLIPKELILDMPDELRIAYEESMVYIGDYFRHWGASRWRTAHRQEIFEALFDLEKREALLTSGITVDDGGTPVRPLSEPYTATDFLQRTHLRPETMDELLGLMEDKRQIVLYGPPGTGKTFVARELGRLLTGSSNPRPEELSLIQFHPAYGYEDFMEGIRPHSREAGEGRFVVDYPVEQGIFRRFCETARKLDGPAVLIIDEINRGNIARIFGELMYLLEYRNQEIVLPYSGERFSIPRNVYLIGTMNTADRSIALVDFALRRRFHFFPFRADADLLARWLESHPVDIPYLLPLYRRLSTDAIDDPDYAIGPSYFMDTELTEEKLRRIWERSIMPYLAEYHLDQRQSVDRWRWDSDLVRGIREAYARD